MTKDISPYSQQITTLGERLQTFVQEINRQNVLNMATDKWSVKNVLCHIVFWHRYYAQQYAALANGKTPFIFKSSGGSTRNQGGVESMKHSSKSELIKLLFDAQQLLSKSIMEKNVSEMNYTDRKTYKTGDFLDMTISHIERHTKQIVKSKNVV